ncbi:MAG: hypothetical protein LC737_01805, partial [Chloroflexi bacterium]|nr:hypothetical protein [Chloroflexota bacterium]
SIVERTPILNELRSLQADIIQFDARALAASVLSDVDVRYVVVHPLTMGAGDERDVTSRMLRQMFGSQAPLVNEPNLVVYRVPAPEPYRPYVTLGEGWGEVEMVNGKPQRTVMQRAELHPHTRGATVTLRVLAQQKLLSAQVKIAVTGSGNTQARMSSPDPLTHRQTIEVTISDGTVAVECSAPLVVESIEVIAP